MVKVVAQSTEMAAGLHDVVIGFARCAGSGQWLAVAVREGKCCNRGATQ
jgi:hypothetical protein